MSNPLFNRLGNEKPMDSALNSAHYYSRRADNHLQYGRYDEAIKCHKETVDFLTKAIAESTIPLNIENLQLQRQHHEKIQQIIARQKLEFTVFLRLNGLKVIGKPSTDKQLPNENPENSPNVVNGAIGDNFSSDVSGDNEFFSLIGDLKIDRNDSDNVVHPVKNGYSDSEEYFSLQ